MTKLNAYKRQTTEKNAIICDGSTHSIFEVNVDTLFQQAQDLLVVAIPCGLNKRVLVRLCERATVLNGFAFMVASMFVCKGD